jgi:hypothetical protein
LTCDFLLLERFLQNWEKLRVELGFYLFRVDDDVDEYADGEYDDRPSCRSRFVFFLVAIDLWVAVWVLVRFGLLANAE